MNLLKIIEIIYEPRQTNLILLGILFVLFDCLGFAAGFCLPLHYWLDLFWEMVWLLFVLIGMTLGATYLYFANFFKRNDRENFNCFKKLEEKFRKSEFIYLLIFRFVGGVPFQIQNVLPCIFDVFQIFLVYTFRYCTFVIFSNIYWKWVRTNN